MLSNFSSSVKVGGVYKHFKGNLYRVISLALHTETNEVLVIYEDVKDQSKVFARPYDMFTSKVDKDKYPDVDQVFRFQLV